MDRRKIISAIAIAVASVMAVGGAAMAADMVIGAKKLVLKRAKSGKEKLVFVSTDPAFLCPAIGTADDFSANDVEVRLFSANEGNGDALTIPAGQSSVSPGWIVRDGPFDLYKYKNKEAPGGPTGVSKAIVLCGKQMKIIAKNAGLPLGGPNGTVGIRITSGDTRNCAFFDSSTLRKDEKDKFIGKNAAQAAVANCDQDTLGGGSQCCEAHAGTGCETTACETKVCAADPFCCSSNYDAGCAATAALLCTECGGLACAPNCPGGTACTDDIQCATGECVGGSCTFEPPPCSPNCTPGQSCFDNSHCASNACSGGVCVCATTTLIHTFSQTSNGGGAFDPAEWNGSTNSHSFSTGCGVNVDEPTGNIDLVGALGDRWRVTGSPGFTSCVGAGGEDNDGCDVTSCPFAGIGSCESTRPSCSVGLNGSGTTTYRVVCTP